MSIADALPKSTEDSLNLRVPGLIAFFYDGYEEGAANYFYAAFGFHTNHHDYGQQPDKYFA